MLNSQKGQIQIVFIVFIVGLFLYAYFAGLNIKEWFNYSVTRPVPTGAGSSTSARPTAPLPETQIKPAPAASTPAGPDTVPPKLSKPQPADKSSLPPETRKTTLGLETDEKATCKYSTDPGLNYNTMQHFFDQRSSTSHTTQITTLSEGEKYKYYIRCSDEHGNKNTDDFIVSFEVKSPEDKTSPILRNSSHQGTVLPVGTKDAVITISTSEPADCRYSTKGGTAYGSMSDSFSPYDQTKQFHTKTVTGLENGKFYDFFVRCRDMAGNANTGDVLINFSVAQ